MKILLYVAGAVVAVHGLIHLMGFVAYWPLGQVAELPYKTTLLAGRWEVGGVGMKLYGLLWLIAALGFLISVAGYFAHRDLWRMAMLITIVLSTALIALDWAPSFRGAIVNAVIAVLVGLAYLFPGGVWTR